MFIDYAAPLSDDGYTGETSPARPWRLEPDGARDAIAVLRPCCDAATFTIGQIAVIDDG